MIGAITDRGLTSLGLICDMIGAAGKSVAYPDFLCPEVIELLGRRFTWARAYHITESLSIDGGSLVEIGPDVIYTVDYFGREAPLMTGTVIRDAVWMPAPSRAVYENEYWFNSQRKFNWPKTGSLMLSHHAPPNYPSLPMVGFIMGGRDDAELRRRENFIAAEDVLAPWMVTGFDMPRFPAVVPLLLPPGVLARFVASFCAAKGLTLPGMWRNAYGNPAPLYERVMLFPCDQRFSAGQTLDRARVLADAITAGS